MLLEPGQEIGPYRIVDKLGEGGMGVVWRADDTRLGRQVALKVLQAGAAEEPGRRSRFEQEARAVAALNHPNIVTLYSIEETDGIYFLTLELVEGERLIEPSSGKSLGLERMLDLAVPMVDGIAAAHAQGIIHRDLKPDNVMLTRDGRVKVLDFGLAKLRPEAAPVLGNPSLSPTETRAGVILGTVSYMSPEQAQGEPIDGRSDIFSIGLMLYEMATGRHPFPGSNPMTILSSIIKDPTPSLIAVSADVPPRLEQIVKRCLEKDREQRYSSAAELRDDLQALRNEIRGSGPTVSVTALPTPATHPQQTTQVTTRPRSRVGLWTVLTGLAIVLAVIALTMVRGPGGMDEAAARPAGPASSVAILPFLSTGDTDDDHAFALGIHDDLITQVSRIGTLKVISRTSVMAFENTDRNITEVAAELGVATVMEGSVRRAGERVRINVNLIDAANQQTLWGDSFDRELTARNVFEIQSEIAQEVATALEATLSPATRQALQEARTDNLEAYDLYLRAQALDRTFTEASIPTKIDYLEEVVALDPSFAEAWATLSRAYLQLRWRGFDRSDTPLERARLALEQAESLQPGLAAAAVARGYYHYWGYRDYPRALAAFADAETSLPNDAALVAVQAFILRRVGRWDESIAQLERAIDLDPLNTYLLYNQANTLAVLRRYDESIAMLDRIIKVDPEDQSAPKARVWQMMFSTGDSTAWRAAGSPDDDSETPVLSLTLEGRYDEALEWLGRRQSDLRASQLAWVPKALERARILDFAGRGDAARVAYAEARARADEALASTPDDPRILSAQAEALAGLGLADAAIAAARRAMDVLPYEKDAMDAGTFVYERAKVHAILGQNEEAIRWLRVYLENPGFYTVEFIQHHPTFEGLRAEEGFKALVARYSKEK